MDAEVAGQRESYLQGFKDAQQLGMGMGPRLHQRRLTPTGGTSVKQEEPVYVAEDSLGGLLKFMDYILDRTNITQATLTPEDEKTLADHQDKLGQFTQFSGELLPEPVAAWPVHADLADLEARGSKLPTASTLDGPTLRVEADPWCLNKLPDLQRYCTLL